MTVSAPPVNVPIVLAGRAPDPARTDEIAVNEVLARDLGVAAGDRIALATMADFETNEPGPEIDATVTGVVRGPFDLINEGGGLVYPTPAFYREFRGQVSNSIGYAVVDLAPGADADAFDADVRHLFGDADGIAVQAGFEGGAPGRDAIDIQVIALLVVGAVVAIGGCVVIAQWLARAPRRLHHRTWSSCGRSARRDVNEPPPSRSSWPRQLWPAPCSPVSVKCSYRH